MPDKVVIYSDGGADPNPGIGGWAAVLRFGDHEKVLTGHDPATTNNRMELQAAVAALSTLKRPCQVEFHTDSEYLRRGITEWIERWAAKGWQTSQRKPVLNDDLWRQLLALSKQHEIDWQWVRGHTGDPLNERVDALARQARLEIAPAAESSANVPQLYLRSSCQGNPGPGGWGVVMIHGDETAEWSGSAAHTTNNRMELTAAVEGLRHLPPGSHAQLFTTSDYLFQGATLWLRGWRRREWRKKDGRPIANADLWQELYRLQAEYKVTWINAKGFDEGADDGRAAALRQAAELATAAVGPVSNLPSTG